MISKSNKRTRDEAADNMLYSVTKKLKQQHDLVENILARKIHNNNNKQNDVLATDGSFNKPRVCRNLFFNEDGSDTPNSSQEENEGFNDLSADVISSYSQNSQASGINSIRTQEFQSQDGAKWEPNTHSHMQTNYVSKNFSNIPRNDRKTPSSFFGFHCLLQATRDVCCGKVAFQLAEECAVDSLPDEVKQACRMRSHLTTDSFCSQQDEVDELEADILADSQEVLSLRCLEFCKKTLPQHFGLFKVVGTDIQAECSLAFLRGLVARKDEATIVPIPNTDYQFRIFECLDISQLTTHKTSPTKHTHDFGFNMCSHAHCKMCKTASPSRIGSQSENDYVLSTPKRSSIKTGGMPRNYLVAALVRKPTLLLDLDDTLVRCRLARTESDRPCPEKSESEFTMIVNSAGSARVICRVRAGVQLLLPWASTLFQLRVVTNSVFEYAKKVVALLDPQGKHLMKGVTTEQHLRELIKSREVLTKPLAASNLGMKGISQFGWNQHETIIFDDDKTVWETKDHPNLLPFHVISQAKDAKSFLKSIRQESWELLGELASSYRKNLISVSVSHSNSSSGINTQPFENSQETSNSFLSALLSQNDSQVLTEVSSTLELLGNDTSDCTTVI